MSELAKITAAPRTDVLPGHAIHPAGLQDYAMVEEELARRHVAIAGAAAVGLPDKIAQMMIQAATDDVAAGRFKYGSRAFDVHMKADSFLPYPLHLLLRRSKPITRDQAAALITDDNKHDVQRAVLEAFNYRFANKPAAEDEQKKAEAVNTTGPLSPPSSETAGSVGQTLQI